MPDREAERKVTETSSSLLARANANDPQAWSTLVSLYAPLVYGWCRRWGVAPHDATKIGKSVLEHIFKKIQAQSNEHQYDSFRGWLFELTRRQYLVYAQEVNENEEKQADENLNTAIYHEPDLNKQDLDFEQQLLFQRASSIVQEMFSNEEWTVFTDLYLKQKTAAEVAAARGCSVESVCITKSKVLRRIRQEFDDLLDF